ncbi:MAG: hypothetical protein ABSE49_10415 [Polyangiaceae bacterium]|jgi:hypothetical protein
MTDVAHVKWERGGEARVVTIDAQAIVLRSTVPSPPGSRIEGVLVGVGGEAAGKMRLRVKVHGSKKQDDGSFVLEGRPLDLPRETREVLEGLVKGA